MSYAFSSGTIGACLEGNVAGVPGLALSQALPKEVRAEWHAARALPPDVVARLHSQGATLFRAAWDKLVATGRFLAEPVTGNVNFPFAIAPDWGVKATRLAPVMYGECFSPEANGGYRHA